VCLVNCLQPALRAVKKERTSSGELTQGLKPDLWPGIRGFVVRRNGVIDVAPPRPLIEDLITLPFPIRSDSFFRGLGIGQMLASRGCPYQCSFCSIHQFYSDAIVRKRRLRSPLNVLNEMEQFFKQGVRIFQ
jgi:anaerobic magnesium-protoporphyrin IX monomethyl ester cyclase